MWSNFPKINRKSRNLSAWLDRHHRLHFPCSLSSHKVLSAERPLARTLLQTKIQSLVCRFKKKVIKISHSYFFFYFSERLLVPKEKKVKKNRSILLTSCEHSFLGKGSFKKANQVPWLLSSPKPHEVHRVGSSFTAYMGIVKSCDWAKVTGHGSLLFKK